MARVLTCLDSVPAQDGTCAQYAFVEQGFTQYLPTNEQAVEIGAAFFVSLFTLAAAKRILKPQKD
ncbi:hypothetical protein LL972_06295 [Xanthomonas campestris pv. asclepiadis]|uniref:hypothetical protein n=1 Tax=Xanthomonas campestris TaxID=339 RepID=UPI001E2AD2A5|nr:hypothetical protein [Xanthomonas campestris]MCC4615624.1 hypothetical protein [Xanthomonas campestris pv. asclepiadis]